MQHSLIFSQYGACVPGWGCSESLLGVQSTFGGFGLINQDNVFKVCDQPHPLLVREIINSCLKLRIDDAYDGMTVGISF